MNERKIQIQGICPYCFSETKDLIVALDGKVFLLKECPNHLDFKILISNNCSAYFDLEDFRSNLFRNSNLSSNIPINFALMCTNKCQIECDFCHIRVPSFDFENISKEDFNYIINFLSKRKGKFFISLCGGEPTLHSDLVYFIEKAKQLKIPIGISTNGLRFLDTTFFKRIKKTSVSEIRISFEKLNNIASTDKINLQRRRVLEVFEDSVEKNNLVLAPIVFKDSNEYLIAEVIDYALERSWIKRVEINGFSWVGEGINKSVDNMLFPDEIMDILCGPFGMDKRNDIYCFQKLAYVLFELFFNLFPCRLFQMILLVRDNHKFYLITDYFHMDRIAKKLNLYATMNNKGDWKRWVVGLTVVLCGIKPLSFVLGWKIFKKYFSGLFTKLPVSSMVLPVVVATNCSVLTYDHSKCGKNCFSGLIFKRDGKIVFGSTMKLCDKI